MGTYDTLEGRGGLYAIGGITIDPKSSSAVLSSGLSGGLTGGFSETSDAGSYYASG